MQKRSAINLLAHPRFKSTFSNRFMVAHAKSRKPLKHKKREGQIASTLAAPPPKGLHITNNHDEPKPEDLAKEEAAAKSIDRSSKAAETEETVAPRGRDRTAYDGDTAIKLYLREIG